VARRHRTPTHEDTMKFTSTIVAISALLFGAGAFEDGHVWQGA